MVQNTEQQAEIAAQQGRLLSRISQTQEKAQTGLHALQLEPTRDGFLYVPDQYQAEHTNPLVLMLHGAGGNARQGLGSLQALADQTGILVLAVDSRRQTWDVIARRSYGSDVAFIDRALSYTFHRYKIDPKHLAIAGFSDGASYALSLGITNGDLFSHVIAFSPGFMIPKSQQGNPQIFVSHGIEDSVLPINACSRRLVPALQEARYSVVYQEFDGPHTIPGETANAALNWFLT